MDYSKHYDRLIETRRNRDKIPGEYYEKHHIVMKSMGGSDDPNNLVTLTAREHFLAHWLLWRIYRNRQSAFAFKSLCDYRNKSRISENLNISSRSYQEAKIASSKMRSIYQTGKKKRTRKLGPYSKERREKTADAIRRIYRSEAGILASKKREAKKLENKSSIRERNSQFGTFWITDGCITKKHRGSIPEGWKLGRTVSNFTKTKISESLIGRSRLWINNGIENSRVFVDEVIPDGWVRGRRKKTTLKAN